MGICGIGGHRNDGNETDENKQLNEAFEKDLQTHNDNNGIYVKSTNKLGSRVSGRYGVKNVPPTTYPLYGELQANNHESPVNYTKEYVESTMVQSQDQGQKSKALEKVYYKR